MNLDSRLLRQITHARFWLALTVFCGLGNGVLIILWARRLSRVVAEVFLQQAGLDEVHGYLVALIVIVLARAALLLVGEGSAGAAAARIKRTLRAALMERLFSLGAAYARDERSGELATVVSEGVESLDAYFSQYLPQLVMAAALPLMMLLTVFPLDWLTGLVLLLTAPLIPLFMILIGKAGEVLTRRQFTALRRMGAYFLDTLQGLTTLKLLNQSQARGKEIAAVGERYRQTTMKVLRLTFLSAFALELIATIGTAIVAVEIGLRLLYGRIMFEQAFFVLLIAPEFYLPLRMLGLRFHAGMSAAAAVGRIFEILNAAGSSPIRNEEGEKYLKKPEVRSILEEQHLEIRFDRVTFAYPQREQAALDNLSFAIAPGTLTALVGPSGAGKSTIFQILLRFVVPQSGQVWVNGVALSSIPAELWRQKIAWVPQRPHLFNTSLAANIALGNPEASREAIVRAARMAFVDEFAEVFPQGLDTMIGEGGARLSGGQAQRVALARAFLRNTPLLLMDEPTNYLDPQLETLLEQASSLVCEGRTVLIIAHRLSTVHRADKILVLQRGRLVQSGTYTELSASSGLYRDLFEAYGQGV
ncbi:MAG: thiol reductant ABC exporter subunit CydD [Anaerolineae bacterium]|nr:thiol reductant ABC exporter subunit CydD [Anaerolineae bacterium]